MTLQEEMLAYRATHNIGQRELARRTRLTLQTIHNVEAGKQNPSKLTETKIRMVVEGRTE